LLRPRIFFDANMHCCMNLLLLFASCSSPAPMPCSCIACLSFARKVTDSCDFATAIRVEFDCPCSGTHTTL
jgi:hypothetical protein